MLLLLGVIALGVVIVRGPGPGEALPLLIQRTLAEGRITDETALSEGGLTVLNVYVSKAEARTVMERVRAALPAGARIIPETEKPQGESPAHGILAIGRGDEKVVLHFLPLPEKPAPKRKSPSPSASGPRRRPVLAICIDDLGQSPEAVEWFERHRHPLNGAVLPFLPHTEETARRLHAAGVEVLCHLPMQPENAGAHPPGPGAILFGTGEPDLKAAVERALDAVPGARGFNNHMGSAMTADRLYMRWVLEAARGRVGYFLDSRTTPQTVAEAVGAELGFAVLRRHVFLDDVAERAYVRRQVREALDKARSQAYVVAIGHPHPATLDALADELPQLERKARLVRLSELVN